MLGRQLGGRYQIIQHVGGGGMADVYQAQDLVLDRAVAIKLMNEQLSHDDEFIQRFIREAQTTGRLSHPNIVNVYDAGQEGPMYYMVMEYVEGFTLKEKIEKSGSLSAKEAISIAMQICDGLAHAHQNGIIHRDIKPHNIMGTIEERYKVTDFGISRFTKSTSQFTKTGTVMGSVHYFSPEQARGQEIGFPSDLYSLGVVLYEMVTGELPFDAEEHVAIALQHIQEPVPDPRFIRSDLPEVVYHIIQKAMEKNPDQRYQSAEEMKQALQQAFFATNLENHSDYAWSTEQTASTQTYEPTMEEDEKDSSPYPSSDLPPKKRKKSFGVKAWLLSIGAILLLFFIGYQTVGFLSPADSESTQDTLDESILDQSDEDLLEEETDELDEPQDPSNSSENHQEDPSKQQGLPQSQSDWKQKPNAKEKEENNQDETHQDADSFSYIVIAGQFSDRERADEVAQQLNGAGISSFVNEANNQYVVQTGTFESQSNADNRLQEVRQSGVSGTENAYVDKVSSN